jgi:hypothetical protein
MALAQFAVRTVLSFRRMRLFIGGKLTGLGIAYPSRERGQHRWAGRRMPDLQAIDGRLYELLRDGRFALVASAGLAAVQEVGARWSDRVRAVRVHAGVRTDLPAVVLVRPDGYVAWASDSPTGDDVAEAVRTWCGPATFAPQPV